jgi:ankyrin repeat protein
VINALDAEDSIDCSDENGYTALHWCAATDQSEKLIPALIALGASVNSLDKRGR